ncbi:MAG TPA: hypothetical protein VLE73_05680 [Candidatus Saccharimonadales bacterium]|nr:hypothetical protein [Candidatus Saccharimonadales bacterium]
MNVTVLAVIVLSIIIIALGFLLWVRNRPRKNLKTEPFHAKWKELQGMLSDKARWAEAVLCADVLLDEALKKKRIRGRTQGERMVKAQHLFSDNDSVWFGHKLRSRIDADPTAKLKQSEVKQALTGIRQALKDIGALQ